MLLKGKRQNSTYLFDKTYLPENALCLASLEDNSFLWHQRLGHASLHLLHKLATKELVRGLPTIIPENMTSCTDCMKGKQVRSSFKAKNDVTSTKPLELLHMDLAGPMRVQSPGGARYMFVLVDDFSRYTWVLFLKTKDQVFKVFFELIPLLETSLASPLRAICSDHGTKFENGDMLTFCREKGITHDFSTPRTPQQNGVVERKNRTLEDMARTMLLSSGVAPTH